MIATERSFLKMFYGLDNYFERNAEIIAEDTIVKETLEKARSLAITTEHFLSVQGRDTTGITIDKNKSKQDLANITYIVSRCIMTFAFDNNNMEVYNSVRKSLKAILRIKDTKLDEYVAIVKKLARKYEAELAAYDLTKELLDKLEAAIKDFENKLTKPREARSEKAAATEKIGENISEMEILVKNKLDNSMAKYIVKNKEFYDEYVKLRHVDDPITRHYALMGNVTDEETKAALQFVAVTIVRFKVVADMASSVKYTTKLGNYRFKSLEPDAYKIIFSLENYDTLEIDMVIHQGESKRLDVQLRKKE